MSELKPCPFCGSGDAPRLMTRHGKDGWRDRYYVLCDYSDGGCRSSSGWYHYIEEAVECWNMRKLMTSHTIITALMDLRDEFVAKQPRSEWVNNKVAQGVEQGIEMAIQRVREMAERREDG